MHVYFPGNAGQNLYIALIVADFSWTNPFFHLVNFPRKHVEIFVDFTFFHVGSTLIAK